MNRARFLFSGKLFRTRKDTVTMQLTTDMFSYLGYWWRIIFSQRIFLWGAGRAYAILNRYSRSWVLKNLWARFGDGVLFFHEYCNSGRFTDIVRVLFVNSLSLSHTSFRFDERFTPYFFYHTIHKTITTTNNECNECNDHEY